MLCRCSSGLNIKPQPYQHELHLLQSCDRNVRTCFGCLRLLRDGSETPPKDLVVVSNMLRPYVDKKTGQKKEGELCNVYFHLMLSCLRKKTPDFEYGELIVPQLTGNLLATIHKRHLNAIGGIKF